MFISSAYIHTYEGILHTAKVRVDIKDRICLLNVHVKQIYNYVLDHLLFF